MVLGLKRRSAPRQETVRQAVEEAPTFERVSWTKEPGLRKLYFYAFVLCIASATTGYDGSFLNAVQVFTTWQDKFGHPAGSELGLIVALYQIGSIVSIPFVPIIADRWGRKVPIIIGCVIMIVGAILQGTANTLGAFMGGRVMMGFGNSLAQVASPMLLAEIAHPQHRGRLTAVYNCLWNVGSIVVTWLSFGTNYIPNDYAWRIPAFLQGFPSVIQIIFIWWVPESPRFLIAQDKHDKALEILAHYHANGNAQHPTVQFEYREIKETIRLEMESKANSSYLDFFKTKGNRYRLYVLLSLGLFSQWSGNAIISNYSSTLYEDAGVFNSNAKFGLAGGQTILALIVSVTMATLVDRWGRRPMFLISTSGMFTVFVFWTLCAGLYGEYRTPGANKALIFFIWLFGFFYSVAWSGLLVGYAIELLPYKLRAKGLMILNIVIQAALCLNEYANPVAFQAFGLDGSWRLYIIYTFWILAELTFIYFMYVETRGPTLEELAKVIDGDDAQVAHVDLEKVEREVVESENVEMPAKETRPHFEAFARTEFDKHVRIDRKDFAAVEFLLRKGRRQLELYSAPGIKDIR
ncbi:sugar transporter [Xylariaceae sp. FL0804]|nr:sugar transporter [Xylariaceae sp. FL0804]